MFDLMELDQAETALRALTTGVYAPRVRVVEQTAKQHSGDISRCPFHNGTMQRESAAA
jgi:hypothetical protein